MSLDQMVGSDSELKVPDLTTVIETPELKGSIRMLSEHGVTSVTIALPFMVQAAAECDTPIHTDAIEGSCCYLRVQVSCDWTDMSVTIDRLDLHRS